MITGRVLGDGHFDFRLVEQDLSQWTFENPASQTLEREVGFRRLFTKAGNAELFMDATEIRRKSAASLSVDSRRSSGICIPPIHFSVPERT